MSFIFSKTIETGASLFTSGNCLIMSPREILSYPLSTNDWGSMRMGGFFSITDASQFDGTLNNGYVNSNTLLSSATTGILNGFYFGFSTGEIGKNSFTFAGLGNILSGNSSSNLYPLNYPTSNQAGTNSTLALEIVSGNHHILVQSPLTEQFYLLGNTYGLTGFYYYHDISLQINKSSKSFFIEKRSCSAMDMSHYLFNDSPYTKISTGNLFYFLTGGSVFTMVDHTYSGYYTSDGSSSGQLLPSPENAIIYWPFYIQKLRIHTFGIVKTS